MKESIKSRFTSASVAVDSILETARECAAYTDPTVLPPEDHQDTERMPEAYTAIGREAVMSLSGKLVGAMYPADTPWFLLELPPHVVNDPDANLEAIRDATQRLMATEITAQSLLESAGIAAKYQRRPHGFSTQKLASLRQLVVTGDSLERIGSDYRIRVYRRDQYVTRRDDAGDVLYHITKESIDPFSLTDEEFAKAKLNRDDLMEKQAAERMVDLYTLCEWQPSENHWSIKQEVNDEIIGESTEKVTPYISTAFDLSPGEHYGRGMVEKYLPTFRTLNRLEKLRLDQLGIMAKVMPLIDHGSMTNENDLAQETGTPLRATVKDGKAQDVGFLGFGNIAEHRSLVEGILQHEQKIKSGFMMLGPSVRDSERTTAFEVRTNASELNEQLGGLYIPITEQQHVPTIRRVLHQMRRDRKYGRITPDNLTEIRSMTGMSAVVRDRKRQALLEMTQVASVLGPEAMEGLNAGVVFNAIMRYGGINEPGAVRTEEEKAAIRQQQVALETQQAAQQAAVNVGQEAATQLAERAIGAQ